MNKKFTAKVTDRDNETQKSSFDNTQLAILLEKSLSGDKRAYKEFLTAISPMLKAHIFHKINNPAQVEDILQETLISIHQSRHTYQLEKPVKPWIYAICHYRINDYLRKLYKQREREVSIEDEAVIDAISSPDINKKQKNVTDSLSDNELVTKALAILNKKQQEIVILMKMEGLTSQEVAIKLNMNNSAVKVSAHRAYKQMRVFLDKLSNKGK